MILIDTSAWVDFFRGTGPYADAVDDLLSANEAALCGPVVAELRRGLRAQERKKVLPLLAGCVTLSQPLALWEEAGELGYLVARRGSTVKTLDLLIAVYALAHGLSVLTKDTDFHLIERAGVGFTVMRVGS